MKIFDFFYKLQWQWDRDLYYLDLADAFERQQSLKSFFDVQLANSKLLKIDSSIRVAQLIINKFASGSGINFQQLFNGIAPKSDQMLLAAVDAAPDKANALKRIAEAVRSKKRSIKNLTMSLLTPIVALPIVGATCLITADIIEQIAKDAPEEIWVGFNGLVKYISEFLNSYWLVILAACLCFVVFLIYQFPRYVGKSRLKIDSWPVFSLYRDYQSSIVLSSMAMMIASGSSIPEALKKMSETGSPWLKWQLNRVLTSLVDNPLGYMEAFSRGLLPLKVRARMASILTTSGSFDEALIALGSSEIERLEQNIKLSSDTLGWSIIGVLGTLAVVLSIGQMTIAGALSNASDPATIMMKQSKK